MRSIYREISSNKRRMQKTFAELIGNESFDPDQPEAQQIANNTGSTLYQVDEDLRKICENTEFMTCPKCQRGNLRVKPTRHDTFFIACTAYPRCKNNMSMPQRGIRRINAMENELCPSCTKKYGSPVKRLRVEFDRRYLNENFSNLEQLTEIRQILE